MSQKTNNKEECAQVSREDCSMEKGQQEKKIYSYRPESLELDNLSGQALKNGEKEVSMAGRQTGCADLQRQGGRCDVHLPKET